jgi:hypothetical protein
MGISKSVDDRSWQSEEFSLTKLLGLSSPSHCKSYKDCLTKYMPKHRKINRVHKM